MINKIFREKQKATFTSQENPPREIDLEKINRQNSFRQFMENEKRKPRDFRTPLHPYFPVALKKST